MSILATVLLVSLLGSGPAISGQDVHPSPSKSIAIKSWGTMREALAQAQTQARVALSAVVTPNTVGIGALAGLAGEVTILDGVVYTAGVSPENKIITAAVVGKLSDNQATLLVLSEVVQWETIELPAVTGVQDLEGLIAQELAARHFAKDQPVPFKVTATFDEVAVHVLNHSCPIANPDGPEPWRGHYVGKNGHLVGIHAVGFGGKLTHHGSSSHIHAIILAKDKVQASGHADSFALAAGSILHLPVCQ